MSKDFPWNQGRSLIWIGDSHISQWAHCQSPEAWNKFWSSARTRLRDLWNRFDLTFEWLRCMCTCHDRCNTASQMMYIYTNQGWQFDLSLWKYFLVVVFWDMSTVFFVSWSVSCAVCVPCVYSKSESIMYNVYAIVRTESKYMYVSHLHSHLFATNKTLK